MPKDNSDFFDVKKEWSIIKDNLLCCYLLPYFTKIVNTGKPVVYVDCFAGKGAFDKGGPGSPLMAMRVREDVLDKANWLMRKAYAIEMAFIEPKHYVELEQNVKGFGTKYIEPTIYRGKYETCIDECLKKADHQNVFLYIDPFGVKCIPFENYVRFSKRNFNSIELLLNLNSFGLLRYACSAMGFELKKDKFYGDYIAAWDDGTVGTEQKVSLLAGGDYWKEIVLDYKNAIINGHQAEERLTRGFVAQLNKSYKYVIDLPIKPADYNHPKYRMIYASNHMDGFLIMAADMQKRSDMLALKKIRPDYPVGIQMNLFEADYGLSITADGESMTETQIEQEVRHCIHSTKGLLRFNELLATFTMRVGLISSFDPIRTILKRMEENGLIKLHRTPALTLHGRPTTFTSEEKGKKLEIENVRL